MFKRKISVLKLILFLIFIFAYIKISPSLRHIAEKTFSFWPTLLGEIVAVFIFAVIMKFEDLVEFFRKKGKLQVYYDRLLCSIALFILIILFYTNNKMFAAIMTSYQSFTFFIHTAFWINTFSIFYKKI